MRNQSGNSNGLDLTSQAFRYINSYKRHRTLAEAARCDGNTDKAIYHELKQYKCFDGLELTLRAIQKGFREIDELGDED